MGLGKADVCIYRSAGSTVYSCCIPRLHLTFSR